jgi:crossover junction endodeoxyribonuclease RuvC
MRILGIDPGLCHMGWGIIETDGNRLIHVAHGTVSTSSDEDISKRLAELFRGLQGVLEDYKPDQVAVEETFVNANPVSALRLGMARGVAMMAPSLFSLRVFEYSANKIKKSVVGFGHANKDQISHMIHVLLPKAAPVKKDAADALAVAICHSHHASLHSRLEKVL